MGKDISWSSKVRKMEHCRPKKGMKIEDIFTDKVVHFGWGVWASPVLKRELIGGAKRLKTSKIADRCI